MLTRRHFLRGLTVGAAALVTPLPLLEPGRRVWALGAMPVEGVSEFDAVMEVTLRHWRPFMIERLTRPSPWEAWLHLTPTRTPPPPR